MNILCLNLWQSDISESIQTSDVINCWRRLVQEERAEVLRELSSLSIGQRKILNILSKDQLSGLTSKKVLKEIDLSGSTVMAAINVLEQKDYIEQLGKSTYRIIDPLIKAAIFFYMN